MERWTVTDRLVRYGAPGGLVVAAALHPAPGGEGTAALMGATGLWVGIHVVQVLLVAGLGVTVRRMLADVDSRAARIARGATVPFIAFYAAFDALVGLGSGIVAQRAADLTGAARQAVLGTGDALFAHPVSELLATVGVLAWLTATLGAAWALRRTEPPAVRAGLVAAGVLFGLTHVGMLGAVGAGALLLAARAQLVARRQPATASPA